MRHHALAAPLALAILSLGTTAPAGAAVVQTSVVGSLGAAENACTQIMRILTATDCTYGNDRAASLGWNGPAAVGGYYAIGSAGDSASYIPAAGDGKIAPAITGIVAIDDGDTVGDGSDDFVSAELVIGAAARNVNVRNGGQAVERWGSLTHTLAATPVSTATANAFGGFDYVIGLQGFPQLICAASPGAGCFASEHAPFPIPQLPGFWAGYEPGGIGIERNANQGGNAGATTTAVFAGYSCSQLFGATDCTTSTVVWGAGEDPGFDNLLLRIVTNSAGLVVSAQGYWTQEFRIEFQEPSPGDNSWFGGTLTLGAQAVPVPAAGWLFATAIGAALAHRRRRVA